MKMHRIELYVIDFENLGSDEYKQQLLNMKHMSGQVKSIETTDIGNWDDSHALNKANTNADVFRGYFVAQPVQPKVSVADKLWLWKNFVNGNPEYWGYVNSFPIHLNSDDQILKQILMTAHPEQSAVTPFGRTYKDHLEQATRWLDSQKARLHHKDCSSHAPSASCNCGLYMCLTNVHAVINTINAIPPITPTAPVAQAEPPKWEVKEAESKWREISLFDFGLYQSLCHKLPDRYQMRIIETPNANSCDGEQVKGGAA